MSQPLIISLIALLPKQSPINIMQITAIGSFRPSNTSRFQEKGPDRPSPPERASCQLVSNRQWIPPKHVTSINHLTFASLFSNRKKLYLPNICVNLVEARVAHEPTSPEELMSFRSKKGRRSQTEGKSSGYGTLATAEHIIRLKMQGGIVYLPKGGQQSGQLPARDRESRPKLTQSCFRSRRRREYIKKRPFHSEKEARGRRQNVLRTKSRQFMNNFLKTRYQTDHRSSGNPARHCNPKQAAIELELTEKYHDFSPWEGHDEGEEYI